MNDIDVSLSSEKERYYLKTENAIRIIGWLTGGVYG